MVHGSRSCYRHGCHCVACRAANAADTARRRSAPPGRVDAGPARAHLVQLAALGVGYRRAAQLAGVAVSTIRRIRAGRVTTIKARIAARIIATAASLARGCAVTGTRTWRFVDSLLREGFSRRALAIRLGHRAQQLSLSHRRVRVRSALRLEALYTHLAAL